LAIGFDAAGEDFVPAIVIGDAGGSAIATGEDFFIADCSILNLMGSIESLGFLIPQRRKKSFLDAEPN
jgi:hypothetical protein